MKAFRKYRPPAFRRYKFVPRTKPRSTRGISTRLRVNHRPNTGSSKLAAKGAVAYQRRSLRTIGKHWLTKPSVIYRGEKEICNPATKEGQAEYRMRILLMWVRQDGLCCDCLGELKLSEATFEHENGRGGGKRDDRVAIFDGDHFVKHLNGVAHAHCNRRRGSQRTPIFHGNNCHIEREKAA